MPIDFPSSPTLGQQFTPVAGTTFAWNGYAWDPASSGGNVSNSGTPTSGQWAQWTDATHIQGVATASTPWVLKAGDTMTGNLSISKSSPFLTLNNSGSGQERSIMGSTNGTERWRLRLGSDAAETGSNVGSDVQLLRFNDAGTFLDVPFVVQRSTGSVALGGYTNGVFDASNAGACIRYSTSQWAIYLRGMSGGTTNYAVSFTNAAGGAVGSITTSDTATTYATTSDGRLKENFQPFSRGREMLDRLPVQEYAWKVGGRGIGLVAQDVEQVHPVAVSQNAEGIYGIDYSKYVPLLIQALQEAHQRIDELEAHIGAPKQWH